MLTTSQTTALLPLLKRLSELQPELCLYNNSYESAIHGVGVVDVFVLANGHAIKLAGDRFFSEPGWQNFAALQWLLQEAIAAQGFVIDAEMYRHADTQEMRWDVFVYNKGRIVIDGSSFRCDDANPAIALLSAYILALEAAAYGTLGSRFCKKLLWHWQTGEFEQAIALVRGDSKDMEALFNHAYHCRSKRICFIPSPELLATKQAECAAKGKRWSNSPVPGSTIFYLGANWQRFTEVFSAQGKIFAPAIEVAA